MNNFRYFVRTPLDSQTSFKPVQRAAVLSRQDLQKIVAQMVG
jgi:hypothetical protein